MDEIYYNPLSDIGKIKENLIYILSNNADVIRLADSFYDTPYTNGMISDNNCAIYIDTHLLKVTNQRIKEVGVDVYVVCHKDLIALSEEDKTYFNSIGIYGNRVDSMVQAIHSAIIGSDAKDEIKKNYSIGNFTFIEEKPIKSFSPGTDFFGKQMSYTYQAFYQRNNHSR